MYLKLLILTYGIKLRIMKENNTKRDISAILEKSLRKVREQLIEKEKKNNGYLVISKDGKVVKVPAKDL